MPTDQLNTDPHWPCPEAGDLVRRNACERVIATLASIILLPRHSTSTPMSDLNGILPSIGSFAKGSLATAAAATTLGLPVSFPCATGS